MSKLLLFLGIAALVLCAVAGGAIVALLRMPLAEPGEAPPPEAAVQIDPALAHLPPEAEEARRRLEAARRAQERLQPGKPYIVIDTHSQRLYLRTADTVLLDAVCSTGTGATLEDPASGRKWTFGTPLGVYRVISKVPQPWWRKPDWEFIQEGEPIPKNEKERLDPNMMGDYAMGFGDGYFIHGTIYERLLGVNVTHGCVRLGSDDLTKLYKMAPMGTPIYIF